MQKNEYLKLLVEGIHSTVVATIGPDGHPQTRTIDMMLWDEAGGAQKFAPSGPLKSGECQQFLVHLMCRREILGFPLPAQRKKVAVRPVISRSPVDHGSDRAGEFFIIHVHFLSNKKTSYPCISTQIARHGCYFCPCRSLIKFSE